jgi:hypothetical protein
MANRALTGAAHHGWCKVLLLLDDHSYIPELVTGTSNISPQQRVAHGANGCQARAQLLAAFTVPVHRTLGTHRYGCPVHASIGAIICTG